MPEGWREVELGEIAETSKTRWSPGDEESALGSYIALEHIEPGRRRIEARGEIETVESQKTAFREGDVLFGKLRPYLRKVAQSDFEGVCSTDVLVYRTRNPKVLHEDYLYYLLSRDATIQYSVANSSGTRMPRISEKRLGEMKVLLPPLVEQRRIADLLTRIDTALDVGEETQARLSDTRSSLLTSLLSGTDPSWGEVDLSALAKIERGLSWSKDKESQDAQGNVPVIRIGNIQRDTVDLTDLLFLDLDGAVPEKKKISKDTVLMVGSNGNPERVGNVAVLPPECEGWAYASFLIGFTPSEGADPGFLYCLLSSSQMQRAITDATSGSTGLKNLSLKWLRSLPVMVPPIDEQRRISSCIGKVEAAITAQRTANERLTEVRTSLLSALLSGEHEIPESYDRFLEEAA